MRRSTRFRVVQGRRRRVNRILIWLSASFFVLAAFLLIRYAWHAAQTGNTLTQVRRQYNAQPEEIRTAPASDAPLAQSTDSQAQAAAHLVSMNPQAQPRVTVAPNAAMLAEFVSLYGKNNDLAGWLHSEALPDIDFPLVQRDNAYYMSHDFYGRDNLAGNVFVDMSSSIHPRGKNIVLHGHNMKNGSMFGKLNRYLDADFTRSSPLFMFSTLYETSTYVPYAVSIVSTDPASSHFAPFVQSDFKTDQDIIAYAERLERLSLLSFPVDVQADDRLLTLATCHGIDDRERLVLALRELRPDEERDALLNAIQEGLKKKIQQ